ncbi:MAG: hypothetical protein CFE21_10710 [Bacteroidetes bacterium B1(2017)]|nr:MAG: hypothetical protein CFE21_10710 [Bacteroidetes bacterium B1(2017)]
MITLEKNSYYSFLKEIKEKIHQAQYAAMRQLNTSLINLYWEIGKSIVEKQKQYGWGKSVVETLSKDLQNEFPGVQGYSARNLWYMRNFFDQYSGNSKLQPLVAEISWSHNMVIMEKCKDDLEREFYIQMAKKYGWTNSLTPILF